MLCLDADLLPLPGNRNIHIESYLSQCIVIKANKHLHPFLRYAFMTRETTIRGVFPNTIVTNNLVILVVNIG